MNLIFNALAIKESYKASTNIKENFLKNDGYYKNSVISLISAKKNNPKDDVALVTNVVVPSIYLEMLESNGVKIYYINYDYFNFSKDMKWSLAFYKLCALKHIIEELDYKNICIIDTDTISIKSFEDMWIEANSSILFYDIQHSLSIEQNIGMNEEYRKLMNEGRLLENKGGEFICGSRKILVDFISECSRYYELMKKKDFKTEYGDEFIIACAYNGKIKQYSRNGNAYIYRYWTSTFYLISTNHIYNQVCILHVPDEKNSGMITLFNYFKKYNCIPQENKLFDILGLPKKRKMTIKRIFRFMHVVKNNLRNKLYKI